ncbi:SusC/RagA family TonB-linked outer membrane protein [Ekhidna sp.]
MVKRLPRFRTVCMTALSLLFFSAQAQTITGKVTSADDGEPLPGVTVQIKGTTQGAITDIDGRYNLLMPDSTIVLVFSYIGFQSQEISVLNQSTIDIEMELDLSELEEVVVIGYGTVQKRDLTGSVFSVKNEDIVKIPSSNPIQALQGKVSGVQISSVSGEPGAAPSVRIRGVGSLNDPSPLYVVDGVIIDDNRFSSVDGDVFDAGQSSGADLSFLNSSDIESIEVLKDASSIAIYGTRGANGVILITTKTGSKGDAKLEFSSHYSFQNVANKIDLLNGRQFAQVFNEIGLGTPFNEDLVANTDWQSLIFEENAPLQSYTISASGATEKTNYFISGNYLKQDGVIPKTDYERISVRYNGKYELTDFFTLGNNLTFSNINKENLGNIVSTAYRAWPVFDATDASGNFLENPVGNALATIEYANNSRKSFGVLANIYAEIKFLKNFTFKSSYQLDGDVTDAISFTPVFFVSDRQLNEENDLTKSSIRTATWLWENTITYSKEFNDHRINGLLGYTAQETNRNLLSGSTENLIREDDDLRFLRNGETESESVNDGVDKYSYLSYLARVNYSFKSKYLITITARIDGTSKFGANQRYGFFPAVGLGWNVTEENFLNSSFITNLKLRSSWGRVGNDKIPWDSRFSSVQAGIDGVFGIPEAIQPGATLGRTSNENLKWEETEMIDVGIEFGMLDNRLSGEVDYYYNTTSDILVSLITPAHFGNGNFVPVFLNAADVRNKGFEFSLNWRDEVGEFSYGVGLVGHTIDNETLSIGERDEPKFGGNIGGGQNVTITRVGSPIGAFYGYRVDGVFQNETEIANNPSLPGQQPGDLRFRDVSGDNELSSEDWEIIGSPIPDLVAGLNFNLGYRSFDLSIDFQGQFGNEIYNGKALKQDIANFETNVLNRWSETNPSNTEPRVTAGGNNFFQSEYFIQDGSFIRLRSVVVGYNFPQNVTEFLKISSARFYLSGTNLFTITDYTGYSPEIGGEPFEAGIDTGVYPITRVFTAGLNVRF